ncbi:alpha/beta fold hydrolase [Aquabacterium sp. OR-4]|uniref:alpha/beta fold hydrolase n=1 Tax=Aquabacterium sp. OR-4 TaxID=2978127 RepID=UPI0021B39C68|nr:alpha/beta fold hydrolase [Aquabacterium sp. OR-4]MDT7835287.1 alpha/beta fold hydrolase [Aquabacterium sp. OR-4]
MPPAGEPPLFHTEWLALADGQRMHIAHAGTPGGLPVLLLHGGPGTGQSPALRRPFDGRHFHIIAPDQRGCGLSTPPGDTARNTLPELLADLRALHRHLGRPRWLVVGGSWGATLAVAHAADLPEAVAGLLLRASFLGRPDDIAAFFDLASLPPHPAAGPVAGGPTAQAAWQALADAAGTAEPQHLPAALNRLFQHAALPEQNRAALAWLHWEALRAGQGPQPLLEPAQLPALRQRYRVQAHHLARGCDLSPTLLQRAARVPEVPTLLLHADDDAICPPAGALALQQALTRPGRPPPPLAWARGAGHGPLHPAMAGLQRIALDHWAQHQAWPDVLPCADAAAT